MVSGRTKVELTLEQRKAITNLRLQKISLENISHELGIGIYLVRRYVRSWEPLKTT